MGSVSDISDDVLVRRAVAHLARRIGGRKRGPLWAAVAAQFALGSGYSMQLCRRFGFDPDQRVPL